MIFYLGGYTSNTIGSGQGKKKINKTMYQVFKNIKIFAIHFIATTYTWHTQSTRFSSQYHKNISKFKFSLPPTLLLLLQCSLVHEWGFVRHGSPVWRLNLKSVTLSRPKLADSFQSLLRKIYIKLTKKENKHTERCLTWGRAQFRKIKCYLNAKLSVFKCDCIYNIFKTSLKYFSGLYKLYAGKDCT